MFPFGKKTKEVQENFERLAKILDALDLPVWQRDESMNVIFCNNAYLQLSETPKGSDKINELNADVKAMAERARTDKTVQVRRLKVITDGKAVEYEAHEIPTQIGSVGYARNAVNLAKVEQKLKEYEQFQRQLLESSASAIAIYGADEKLQFFNQAFINQWRFEEAWLGTKPKYGEILELLREKRKLPEQADFRTFKQENLAMFKTLINPKEDFYFLPDERALRVIIIPHALGGLQFIYEDMTDKLALEAKYNTLLAVQSETLANLHEGVAVFGESGRLTLSNKAFTGLLQLEQSFVDSEPSLQDILEKTKDVFNYEGEWEVFVQELSTSCFAREQSIVRLELKTGIVLDMKNIPLPDGEVLLTFNDITDSFLVERSLREANRALEDVDHLKTEFLTNISYELRSPLTSIIGFTEVLRQEIFGELNTSQKDYLQDIYSASKQLEALINDILDISSIEAGYLKLNAERFDIHSMMTGVIVMVKERINEHNLNFEFECAPQIGKMFGDETRVKQIIFNVISNSIKFTPAGGDIKLSATVQDKNVILIIEDTGEGMSAEEQKQIFKKFYKTNSKGGSGLGLSVARNFTELHRGEIEVDSELGKGTKVTVRLPIEDAELVKAHQDELTT